MTENGQKKPILGPPVHTAKVAEKSTCPAGRDENANAKNGLTLKVRRNAQWLELNLWSKFILLDVFLEANIVMVTSLNPMEMQVILEKWFCGRQKLYYLTYHKYPLVYLTLLNS